MHKFGKKSNTAATADGPEGKSGFKGWYKSNQRSIIAVAVLAIIAFGVRAFFSYGTSANSNFALSGGTSASEHLHTVVQIITGGSFFGTDYSINYPYGSLNTNPVLFDLLVSPFAFILKAFGFSATTASSAALAASGVALGTLCTIMAYFLGKEILGSKKAGFLAALFMALCPVVISSTVFSNGTGVGFYLLLTMMFTYFMFKGVKAYNDSTSPKEKFGQVLRANKAAMRYGIIAAAMLSLLALSWNGYRSVVTIAIFCMATLVLIDRFTGKDARVPAVFFSMILLITSAVTAAYYIPAGLWSVVLSGVLIATLLAVAVTMLFAFTQKIPWTLTVPVFAVVLIAGFVVLKIFSPEYFSDIVIGNSVYVNEFLSFTGTYRLNLSTVAGYFGFLTFWFPFIMVGAFIWTIGKNIGNPARILLIVWACISLGFTIMSSENTVILSAVYAVGFASVLVWIFDNIDFKSYFAALKTNDVRTFLKRFFRPIPFLAIFMIVVMICAPNALYAIDSSISTNDAKDFKGINVRGGYYVKTNDSWVNNDVLASYGDGDNGTMATWATYAYDASTFGNFRVVADDRGNGASAVANMLLSENATAAMLLYLLDYNGFDNSKSAITSDNPADHLLTADQFEKFKNDFYHPDRAAILNNPEVYGTLSADVSDENLGYIYAIHNLMEKASQYTVSNCYEKLSAACGKSIDKIMVTSQMIPIYRGQLDEFMQMAIANGYKTDNTVGVPQFLQYNYLDQYTGITSFKDTMYKTLMWRAYIGMSPEEAGFGAGYTYISALMLSNGNVQLKPGYGLANYEVDQDHWFVKYNPDNKADLSSDGWVKMKAVDAQNKQKVEGGLINYLAGYPIILNHVTNSAAGTSVDGTVTYQATGGAVENVRVTATDVNGIIRSVDYTDSNGKYTVLAKPGYTIEYAAATTTLTDGTVFKTVTYASGTSAIDAVVPTTSISGKLVDSDGKDFTTAPFAFKLRFVGETNKTPQDFMFDTPPYQWNFAVASLVPDIYTITVMDPTGNITYATKEITLNAGDNDGLLLKLSVCEVTINTIDSAGVAVPGVNVSMIEQSGAQFGGMTDSLGTVKIKVVPGTYRYYVDTTKVCNVSMAKISSSTTQTLKVLDAQQITLFSDASMDGKLVSVSTFGYNYTARVSDGKIAVPMNLEGVASPGNLTVYSVAGANKIYLTSVNTDGTLTEPVSQIDACLVKGVLKNSSDTGVAGTVTFMKDGKQIPVSSNSDGNFSILLPINSSYKVYANTGNQVYVGTVDTAAEEKDMGTIKMEEGTQVSGTFYWKANDTSAELSSSVLAMIPLTIVCDGNTYNAVTGFDGSYSFYLPKDKTCNVTATLNSTARYTFGDPSPASKTLEGVNGTQNFSVKLVSETAQVHKAATELDAYKVKIGSVEITTAPVDVKITGTTWSVNLYYGTTDVIVGSASVPARYGLEITKSMFTALDDHQYYLYTLEGYDAASMSVTVKALDEGDDAGIYKISSGKCLLEKDKTFQITVKSNDSKQIFIKKVKLTASDESVTLAMKPARTINGFTGLIEAGKLTVRSAVTYSTDDTALVFDVNSSGRYSIVLPLLDAGDAYTFDAEIKTAEDTTKLSKYVYNGSRTFLDTEFNEEKEYMRNIAVSSDVLAAYERTNFDNFSTTGIIIDEMSDDAIAEVNFHFTMTNLSAGKYTDLTVKPTAGSGWIDMSYYSDAARTEQKTTFTVLHNDVPVTVYAKGHVDMKSKAVLMDTLDISIKDINDNKVGYVFFDQEAGWKHTAENKTQVNFGSDAVTGQEYEYSLKVLNKDNFTKDYSLSISGVDASKWYCTIVTDKIVTKVANPADFSAPTMIKIPGNAETTVYVKITLINGESTEPPTATIKLERGGETFVTDESSGIAISDGSMVSQSQYRTSLLKATDISASGRNVFNDKGSLPTYIWVMVGAMVLIFMVTVWLGMKRGVFSRRK